MEGASENELKECNERLLELNAELQAVRPSFTPLQRALSCWAEGR